MCQLLIQVQALLHRLQLELHKVFDQVTSFQLCIQEQNHSKKIQMKIHLVVHLVIQTTNFEK